MDPATGFLALTILALWFVWRIADWVSRVE